MQNATLTTATTRDINEHMSELMTGNSPEIKDGGFANSTVRIYQSALRTFYKFHDDLDVEPEDIAFSKRPDTTVDETELFDAEDVQAIRDAIDNSRDKCFVELLLNTGQRVRAIQTLRIKDVFPDEGRFRLNPDVDGLKHAEGKRPLLGAVGPVKEWLQYHPTNEPDDYLLTVTHDNNPSAEFGEMIHRGQLNRRLKVIGERADVDKPMNAHNFRHHFVTEAYRRYDMNLETIRWMIGHGESSRVMEETYQHLTDEDRAQQAEVSVGVRDEVETENTLLPPTCPICDEPTSEGDAFCSKCGTPLTPSAEQSKDDVRRTVDESVGEARANDDERAQSVVDTMKQILADNPELYDELESGRSADSQR